MLRKNITSDSLSGKNRSGRAAGVGSSPTRSILWKRLRELDREYSIVTARSNLDYKFPFLENPNPFRVGDE